MDLRELLLIESIRVAQILFWSAAILWIATRPKSTAAESGRFARFLIRTANGLWLCGALAFWIHVLAAFHFQHQWSFHHAETHVADRSEEIFSLRVGWGIWFNFLFGAVWCGDVTWCYRAARQRDTNWWPRWRLGLGAFMVFMWLNGAVIFAKGFSRWLFLFAAASCLGIRLWQLIVRRDVQ